MGIIYNQIKQKKLRQHLRRNAPEAEQLLWTSLKNSQLLEYKFRRQQGVGKYVVDFYCPAKKVAIEIDGETHWREKDQIHDEERRRTIEALGIRILRFTNDDVYTNRDSVLETILRTLEECED